MELAQNSEPVKSPFHKSDISKQSPGVAALQMHAISGLPRICEMSISWSSSPGRASQSPHKAPKCEREHHQRSLFCLVRAFPSRTTHIIPRLIVEGRLRCANS